MAVIGAGPSGLAAAKHALEAGFEPTVFEASGALGGQWQSDAPHSGVWPGMRTNTSRAMTAFSDFPAPPEHALHPLATQTLGPILDGLMRNTPDALAWIERAEADGVRAAVEDRDGPFGDYSQAPPERRPDPRNVIE